MKLSSIIVPSSNQLKNLSINYSGNKQYTFQLADIITQMNVISSQSTAKFNRQAVTSITIGSNVSSIGPSCFIDCQNLQNVTTHNKLKDIGDYAFKDCQSLTSITVLGKNNQNKLHNIGISAFANTGLKHVSISLSGTSTATQIMPYAFAGCRNLKSVENVRGNYLADYEFADCTSLTSVTMPNSHSFSGEYSFKNCTSLSSVEIPANTFMINTGLFMGCSALTSVKFNEPSKLGFYNCIQNNVFNGTPITSLTFPTSITSYSYIAPYALANMPYLQEIHFAGMPKSSIAQTYESNELNIDTGMIYSSIINSNIYGVFDSTNKKRYNPAYAYSNYFKDCSETECRDLLNMCMQNGIPVILVRGQDNMSACPKCKQFAEMVTHTQEFLDWVKSQNNKYAIIETSYTVKIPPFTKKGGFPYLDLYWKDQDSGQIHWYSMLDASLKFKSSQKLIDQIYNTFNGYSGSSSTMLSSISVDLIDNHCFGLNHDVMLFGNDSLVPIQYKDDGTGTMPSIIYDQTIQVDRLTIDDFRYNQWYYNAEQLRKYADQNYLPVLVEFGSKNCGPCEDFGAIFNSKEFQQLVTSKKILLCRLGEETSFGGGQAYYVSQEWAIRGEYPEGKMPILMFYWKQRDGASDGQGNYFDKIHKVYAHFNDRSDTSFPYCPLLYDKATVLNWIQNTCFKLLDDCGYVPNSKFNRPTIARYSQYPRYNKYANYSNDSYGRYYPVHALHAPRIGVDDQYTISVLNASNVLTKYTINARATSEIPPNGTYQYFTTLSDASVESSWYETNYDISGVMFKVGAESTAQYLTSDSYLYGEIDLTSYCNAHDVSGTNIASYTSSFNDLAYIYDENGDPTTQINIDEFRPGQPIYNVVWTYNTRNIIRSSKNVSKVKAYTSAEVEVKTDSRGKKYLDIVGSHYVISANYYWTNTGSNKIMWLSTFTNYSE